MDVKNSVLNIITDRVCLHSQTRGIPDRNVERDLVQADYFYRIDLAVDRTLNKLCNDRTADAAGSIYVNVHNGRVRHQLSRCRIKTQIDTRFRITRKSETSDERRSIITVKRERSEYHSIAKTDCRANAVSFALKPDRLTAIEC